MKGGNVKKFIDQTTYEECAIIYKGVKYFFHGIMFDKEKKNIPMLLMFGIPMEIMKKLCLTKPLLLWKNVQNLLKMNLYLKAKPFGKQNRIWNGLSGKPFILADLCREKVVILS